MSGVPGDRLWQWWRNLATLEISLERRYRPLVNDHGKTHAKRITLEQLIVQELEIEHQKIADEWHKLLKSEDLPLLERRPTDVVFDVLSQSGSPMYYKTILEEIGKAGIVIGGRDPGTTLIVYLGRDKRFAKAPEEGRGYYKLKEWET